MKKEFIEGRWYKNLGINRTYIAKYVKSCDSLTGFWLFEYINEHELYCKTRTISHLDSSDAKLITDISEIAHLLPKDHPDLKNIEKIYELW